MEGIEVPRDQKPVHALHEGVPQAFLPISESNVDYSTWIAEGTNNKSKVFTSCLLNGEWKKRGPLRM